MRLVAAVTLVAMLTGCAGARQERAPGSDVVTRTTRPPKVTTTAGRCMPGRLAGVTRATIGPDRVSVGSCTSVSTDTAPDASLDGRTPQPPVP